MLGKLVEGNQLPLFLAPDGTIRIDKAENQREGERRIDHAGFDLTCRMDEVVKMNVKVFVGAIDAGFDLDQVTFFTEWGGKRWRLVEWDQLETPACPEAQKNTARG